MKVARKTIIPGATFSIFMRHAFRRLMTTSVLNHIVSVLSIAFEATRRFLKKWKMVWLTKLTKTLLSNVRNHHFPLLPESKCIQFLCLGYFCTPPAVDKTCLGVSLGFVFFAIIYIAVIVYFIFQWKEFTVVTSHIDFPNLLYPFDSFEFDTLIVFPGNELNFRYGCRWLRHSDLKIKCGRWRI